MGTILDLFSLPMVRWNAAEAALELFQGSSPLRVRPILRDSDGTMVVVHSGMLIPALRERGEKP
ncbi:hypothetical protein [Dactylosporangium sp. NPDC005555]|uniref:hypothetical protein n=1 Tax=Dactylosporangium sp. NPDC005555 TaxID=3154889 RepID=UPI00339FE021